MFAGVTFGMTKVATAQPPPGAAEHEDPIQASGMSHSSSGAHLFRENDADYLRPFRQRAAAQVAAGEPRRRSRGTPEFDGAGRGQDRPDRAR